MNTNMAVRQAWSSDGTLVGLLGVSRLFFEEMKEEDKQSPEYPYAVWKTLDDSPEEVTSLSFIDEELFQLVIYTDNYASAKDIQRESRRVLRNSNLSPDDDGLPVLFEKRGGSLGIQEGSVFVAVDEYALVRSRSR